MGSASKINPLLTLEYMQSESENKFFDRKSSQIRVAELAPYISAFANAAGGTLVIGISDKKKTIEGINACGEDKINEFINAPKDCCRPMPRYREEYVDVVNTKGESDRLLLLHIEASKDQLRVFTAQDAKTGKFIETPEYPEFPWLEGIVNAVAHRDYAMTGAYIKVSMYDDRLEIESPGCLPDLVNVDNIRDTRFSRNPKISRVLTEFGYVRELNEGVKKIYSDMSEAKLPVPEYSDSANSVRLVLRNNIDIRTAYRKSASENLSVPVGEAKNEAKSEAENEAKKNGLKLNEQIVLELIKEDPKISQNEITKETGYSRSKVQRITKALQEKKIVSREGGRKGGSWKVLGE